MSRDPREYVYRLDRVERVVDGDTYWLHLDVGFRQTQLTHVRLDGFDTPELFRPENDHEAAKAREAREFVVAWLGEDGPVYVHTRKDPDSFGRWLGVVFRDGPDDTWVSMGEQLAAQGLASVWPTRWREEHGQ